jgi:alpha-L-rhamnosidase
MYGIYAPGTWKRNPGYGTGWSDAGIIVPWTSWIQTGDLSIIRQNWDGMKSYLDAILSANSNYLWARNYGIAFGDWLAPEGATSEELIATAYWAYDVTLMQQMARAIGKDEEASAYADLFNNIKKAFNKAYVQPSGFVGAALPDKSADPVETQTGYVLALHMNLLADELRSLAADRLVAMIKAAGWKLGTGFLGTPYLLEVLSDTGHADIAYQLLLNTEYPSWGYMVEHGATTMWERWNGDQMRNDPGMNSYNHYAYGAVAEWLYRYAAGIDTVASDPGFHTILLHPHFDPRLGSLEFSYESRYGEIKSSWKDADGELSWTVTIPANTKAALPLTESESQAYTLNGEPITKSHAISKVDKTKTGNLYELGSGVYVFQKR